MYKYALTDLVMNLMTMTFLQKQKTRVYFILFYKISPYPKLVQVDVTSQVGLVIGVKCMHNKAQLVLD